MGFDVLHLQIHGQTLNIIHKKSYIINNINFYFNKYFYRNIAKLYFFIVTSGIWLHIHISNPRTAHETCLLSCSRKKVKQNFPIISCPFKSKSAILNEWPMIFLFNEKFILNLNFTIWLKFEDHFFNHITKKPI